MKPKNYLLALYNAMPFLRKISPAEYGATKKPFSYFLIAFFAALIVVISIGYFTENIAITIISSVIFPIFIAQRIVELRDKLNSGKWKLTPKESLPSTTPYIVTLTNMSDEVIENATIFDADNVLFGNSANWDKGNIVQDDLVISSLNPGTTYSKLLAEVFRKPFICAKTYIQSANSLQVIQSFLILNEGVNGGREKKTMINLLDPYQFQNGILSQGQRFLIDGQTKIVIAKVLPRTVVSLFFFPVLQVNISESLQAKTNYGTSQDFNSERAETLRRVDSNEETVYKSSVNNKLLEFGAGVGAIFGVIAIVVKILF